MRRLNVLWPLVLAACAPSLTVPQSQLSAQTSFSGNLLSVTLVNSGPVDLLLENACPRPFEVQVSEPQSGLSLPARAQQLETCSGVKLPPLPWPVGQAQTAAVILNLPSGAHELRPLALVRVQVAPGGKPQGEYRTLRVGAPAVTLKVP